MDLQSTLVLSAVAFLVLCQVGALNKKVEIEMRHLKVDSLFEVADTER